MLCCCVTCLDQALNLLGQSISRRLVVADKSCQASVLGQEAEEEAGHLGTLLPLYLAMAPLPVCLPGL